MTEAQTGADNSIDGELERIVARIGIICADIANPRVSDNAWCLVNEKLRVLIREEFFQLIRSPTQRETVSLQSAARRAIIKYGGSCKSCSDFKQIGDTCKPESERIYGCKNYRPTPRSCKRLAKK